jgi:thioredoxin 1
MTSKVTPVTSSAHFRSLTSSATYTVVDFYADWCGPCKVIAPIFEQLAAAESKPGKIIFVKVDVDAQREIAGNYGVSAYVLSLLFHDRKLWHILSHSLVLLDWMIRDSLC